MISAVLEGVIMGLFLSVFIGPVFFLLIETSIKRGVKEALIMDAGVLLSDLMWILILWWGFEKFLGDFIKSPNAMVFAGIVFISFGLISLFSGKNSKNNAKKEKKKNLFFHGFLLNSINPSVAIFWLATISFSMSQFDYDRNKLLLFFTSLFVCVILIDLLKFNAAKKLGRFLNEARKKKLSFITSIILILFGFYMISTSIFSF